MANTAEIDRWVEEFCPSYRIPKQVSLLVAAGVLEDHSWHNDASPSFVVAGSYSEQDDYMTRLWIDHPDPEMRQDDSYARYTVITSDLVQLYSGDVLSDALTALHNATGKDLGL